MILMLLLIFGWVEYPTIRDVKETNTVLKDIRDHLPATHNTASHDKVNYVHEGTHFINSQLRIKYHLPGFYCLNNKAYILPREPIGTIAEISNKVPIELRGSCYKLYLIDQQKDWNKQPSYLFDEWSSYINGSASREKGTDRTDTIEHMLQFVVYCYYVPGCKELWKYQLKRSLEIYKKSGYNSTYYNLPGFQIIIKSETKGYDLW